MTKTPPLLPKSDSASDPAHADASPSAASIWLVCPASVTQARGRVRHATEYTREGTAAHTVAELAIHGLKIPDEIEVEGEVVEVTDDMLEHVQVYVDHCDRIKANAFAFSTEVRVTLDWLAENIFGTADAYALYVEDGKLVLEIVDLKFGRGYSVEAVQNPQLRIYGLGLLMAFDAEHKQNFVGDESIDRVKLTVIQPRISGEPMIKSETLSPAELRFWGLESLAPAVDRIADGDPTEIPGVHCRWCVRAGTCKSLAELALEEVRGAFTAVPTDIVRGMSNDDLSNALDKIELINAWVNLIRHEASSRVDVGQVIPHYKLVPKRAMRKWIDEDAALVALTDAGVPIREIVKAVSPAAAERALKAHRKGFDVLNGLYDKQSSGTTLVRAEDPREALANDPQSMFGVISSAL